MTVGTSELRDRRRGLLASAIAWVWPAPRRDERAYGYGWLGGLGAWLWPSRLQTESFGRRHGLMATLFGWMWPGGVDRGMRRFWRNSWLWAWMWPGRVMGPHGEICPLAPWHPAARPEVLATDPWHRKVGRHGGAVFMMFAASAIAAPTFMEGNNILDGGRLNLFRGGGDAGQESGPTGGGDQGDPGGAGGEAGDPGGNPGAGGGGGAGGPGGSGGSGGGDFGPGPDGGGLEGGSGDGQIGGGNTPPTTGPNDPANPSDPGPTTIDPPSGGGDDLSPESGLIPGGGGGGGGQQPTDPQDPDTGNPTNPGGGPFDPPGPTPPGTNPPQIDPPGPLNPPTAPPEPPFFPQLPGGKDPLPNQDDDQPIVDPGDADPGDEDPGDPGHTGPAPVPEPGVWAMMIMGFGAVGYAIRRRRVTASVR